jgi:hypothetical protein
MLVMMMLITMIKIVIPLFTSITPKPAVLKSEQIWFWVVVLGP